MLNDLLDLFKQSGDSEQKVLASYIPKKGLYIKINPLKMGYETLLMDNDQADTSDLAQWFREADFYSSLIEMNKPVDPKKTIHSNNYLSLFIKADILPQLGTSNKKLTHQSLTEAICRYYEVLAQEASLEQKAHINNKKEYLLTNLDDLLMLIKENLIIYSAKEPHKIDEKRTEALIKKSYVKIFFAEDLEIYKAENKKYLVPRIFNKSEFDVRIDGTTFGLSNTNINMNDKKPYLEYKTTNFKVPFRVTVEDAICLKNFIDWLGMQKSDNGSVYIPYKYNFINEIHEPIRNGAYFYIHFDKGINITINDFDFLPEYRNELSHSFSIKNYLSLVQENEQSDLAQKVTSISSLEELVDKYFFYETLKKYYFAVPKDIKSNDLNIEQKSLLIIYRKALHDYFRKGDERSFVNILDKLTLELLIQTILASKDIRLVQQANAHNLRLALLEYFKIEGKVDMGACIEKARENIEQKLKSAERTIISSDDEFYYAAGQVVRFLFGKSQAQQLKHSAVKPYIAATTSKRLKDMIINDFNKYAHAIAYDRKKFNRMLEFIMAYQPETQPKAARDVFLSGYLADNLLYKKDKKEGD